MIKIGTALPGSGGNAGNPSTDSDRVSSTRLFGADSTKPFSHNLHADMAGLVFQAFGLEGADQIVIQMVVGQKEGDLYQDIVIGGKRLILSKDNSVVFIAWPGRFRAAYIGQRLGEFHAFAYASQTDTMNPLSALMPLCMS